MNCRRCQLRLSERLDGDLSTRAARAVDDHLAGCSECAAVRDEMAVLCGLFAELGGLASPGCGSDDVEGGDDPLWSRIDAELRSDEAQRTRRRLPWMWVPVVGGAALVAMVGAAERLRGIAAQRDARAVDFELRQSAAQAVRRTEWRYDDVERAVGQVDRERPAVVPRSLVFDSGTMHGRDVPAPTAEWAEWAEGPQGIDSIEARLAARRDRIAAVAEVLAQAAPSPDGMTTSITPPVAGGRSGGRR